MTGLDDMTEIPVDVRMDGPHDWEQIRADMIAELTAVLTNLAPEADAAAVAPALADAALAVCDDEAIQRMAEHYVERSGIRSMDFRNGVNMDLAPAQELVANWVACARTMLGDAVNYVTMDVKLAGEIHGYSFVLQRREPGKLTPHQARQLAERNLHRIREMAVCHRRSRVAREILSYLSAIQSVPVMELPDD
jgi:hypothetical protein